VRRSVALLAVVIVTGSLVLGVWAGPAAGQSGGGATDLTLEQLRPNGQHPANAPPSVRAAGSYSEYAVKDLPTGLLVQEGEESPSWRYLRKGTTVNRDKLQLWSKRGYSAEQKEVIVRVAYWTTKTRTVTTDDGSSREETIARNVSTHSTQATLGPGYDYLTINLRSHFDTKRNAVMCVQEPEEANCLENPGETRWRFQHQTSATSKAAPVNSLGGQLAWGYGWLVLPFFGVASVTLYGGRIFVRRAKSPPNISPIWYVVGAIIVVLFLILGWDWVSNTLATAPWLISAVAGIILGIMAVEWFSSETYNALFLRFSLTDGDPDPVGSPPGDGGARADGGEAELGVGEPRRPDDAPGVLSADAVPIPFARGEDGIRTAVRDGLRRWWARARGARADFKPDGNMQTRIEVDKGPYEELYLLHPEDEEPLQYQPEHHELTLPELIEHEEVEVDTEEGVETTTQRRVHLRPYLLGIGWLGASAGIGKLLAQSPILGLLLGAGALTAVKIARPISGELSANLAPLHYHRALATMLTHADGLSEAKAWDTLFRDLAEERAENKADKAELRDEQSTSQLDQLFDRFTGEGPVGRVSNGESKEEAPADD